jgi:hypothetical protein
MWDSTRRRIASSADALLDYLLFVGEPPLTEPLAGTTTFASDFAAGGKRDPQGRSLRDLDLKTRLFRYPCSYLIDSEAFAALPEQTRHHVLARLGQILRGAEPDPRYAHLSPADRQAIREILQATHPEWVEVLEGRG